MELHVSATFPFTDSCNFVLWFVMRTARASRSSYSEPDAFVIINSKILSKTCLIIVINKRSKDTVIKKEGKKKTLLHVPF